jgi:hypothetical protein
VQAFALPGVSLALMQTYHLLQLSATCATSWCVKGFAVPAGLGRFCAHLCWGVQSGLFEFSISSTCQSAAHVVSFQLHFNCKSFANLQRAFVHAKASGTTVSTPTQVV